MRLNISDDTMASVRAAQELAASGRVGDAIVHYKALLEAVSGNDCETAAVAHMYALIVDDPAEKLAINEQALRAAEACPPGEFAPAMFASLYANLGYSKIGLGDIEDARRWYEKAAAAAEGLDDDEYGRTVRGGIATQLQALR